MKKIVLITVANDYQKKYLKKYIKEQQDNHMKLYSEFDFSIIVSANGSGTAVMDAISIKNKNNYNKLLLINSGGKSNRTKMFSKKGKVFIPIPTKENSNRIILDELLYYYHKIENNIINNGILVFAADTIIDNFSINYKIDDTCAITTFSDLEIGKDHGVFLEENGMISKFLHKQPIDILIKEKAVVNKKVLIDTGIYFIKNEDLDLINDNYQDKYNRNEFLDFYGEFIPFLQKKVKIKLFIINNGVFKHLGNYKYYRDYIYKTNKLDKPYFTYNSIIGKNVNIGSNSLIFNCKLNNINIPDNSVVYEEDGEIKIDDVI